MAVRGGSGCCHRGAGAGTHTPGTGLSGALHRGGLSDLGPACGLSRNLSETPTRHVVFIMFLFLHGGGVSLAGGL